MLLFFSSFPWLGVAFFGALGSLLRYFLSNFAQRFTLPDHWGSFPIGTLCINWLGSGILVLVAMSPRTRDWNEALRTAIAVGGLGGFTTYSTFNLETFQMLQSGRWVAAALYIGLTLIGALGVAVWVCR